MCAAFANQHAGHSPLGLRIDFGRAVPLFDHALPLFVADAVEVREQRGGLRDRRAQQCRVLLAEAADAGGVEARPVVVPLQLNAAFVAPRSAR